MICTLLWGLPGKLPKLALFYTRVCFDWDYRRPYAARVHQASRGPLELSLEVPYAPSSAIFGSPLGYPVTVPSLGQVAY